MNLRESHAKLTPMKKLIIFLTLCQLASAQTTLDTNGDGQIDQAEWQAASAQLKAKYDTNGDGQLDEAEKEAARQALRSRLDTNKDGKVDQQERQNIRARLQNRRGQRTP